MTETQAIAPTEGTAYHLASGEGPPMAWFTATFHLKASTPALGLCEVRIEPGVEPPLHVHSREDEWFYVLEGDVTFHVGDERHRGGAGSLVYLPRRVPHTFTVESPSARMLLLNAPGGLERMFELAPSTPDEAAAALGRYDVDIVGPHPREAG